MKATVSVGFLVVALAISPGRAEGRIVPPPAEDPPHLLVIEPQRRIATPGKELPLRLRLINQSRSEWRGCVHYPRECQFIGEGWMIQVTRCASLSDPCEAGADFHLAPGSEFALFDYLTVPDDLVERRFTLRCTIRIFQIHGSRKPIPDSDLWLSSPPVDLTLVAHGTDRGVEP